MAFFNMHIIDVFCAKRRVGHTCISPWMISSQPSFEVMPPQNWRFRGQEIKNKGRWCSCQSRPPPCWRLEGTCRCRWACLACCETSSTSSSCSRRLALRKLIIITQGFEKETMVIKNLQVYMSMCAYTEQYRIHPFVSDTIYTQYVVRTRVIVQCTWVYAYIHTYDTVVVRWCGDQQLSSSALISGRRTHDGVSETKQGQGFTKPFKILNNGIHIDHSEYEYRILILIRPFSLRIFGFQGFTIWIRYLSHSLHQSS